MRLIIIFIWKYNFGMIKLISVAMIMESKSNLIFEFDTHRSEKYAHYKIFNIC